MLSLENLKYYCRTCLVKLEVYNEDEDSSKFIVISKYPDLEQIMKVNLAKTSSSDGAADAGGDDAEGLCLYVPHLCRSCYDKWLDFLKHYQLAVKNEEKIRKILEKAISGGAKQQDGHNDEIRHGDVDAKINQFFIQSEPLIDISEIEKYETTSPFYTDSRNSNISTCELQQNQILSTSSDPTLLQNQDSSSILATIENEKSDDDISLSYSDNLNDIEFNPESPPKASARKSKKSTKSNQKSKPSCKLRKKYKTRKSKEISTNVEDNSDANNGTANESTENSSKKVRYQCEQCNKYFWEKNKYDGHMKQVHEGIRRPYQCQECGKAYNLYKTLLQHTRETHTEKSEQEIYKCDDCNKIFKTAVILKQHLTNTHSEQKEAIRSICDQCGFIAANQYSLSQHIKNKHTETDHIKCEQCPKLFKTHYSLKYHMLGFHNPMNIRPFKCPECQMGFTRKTLLNQHKRTHLKYTERIKCDFEGCDVRFVKRGDKTHHMRLVHLKVKQHICDFCGEAFGAMQTLRHHRFIHTGEKPYKCNVCGQGFRQRTAMKTHRKTHFGKDAERQDIINNLPEINLSLVNNLN